MASVGAMIAPSVNAAGHVMPAMTACAIAATITVVKITRPIVSRLIGRKLRLNSTRSVVHAAPKRTTGSTIKKIKSGCSSMRGRFGTKPSNVPATTNTIG